MMTWTWIEHVEYANRTEKSRYMVMAVALSIISLSYLIEFYKEWVNADE